MTYDLAIFVPGPSLAVPSKMQLFDATDPGLVVTGIVKLAQRFLLTLLTPVGSRPFAPASGTRLLPTIRTGNIANELDARMAMLFAISDAEMQLVNEEDPTTDPADERFLNAEVLQVSFLSRGISYTLRLTSRAGTTREVTLPLRSV